MNFRAEWGPGKDVETVVAWPWFLNTPIQEKTGSRMETRPKGPSVFASPGGKYKLDKQSLSKEFQDGASKY